MKQSRITATLILAGIGIAFMSGFFSITPWPNDLIGMFLLGISVGLVLAGDNQ